MCFLYIFCILYLRVCGNFLYFFDLRVCGKLLYLRICGNFCILYLRICGNYLYFVFAYLWQLFVFCICVFVATICIFICVFVATFLCKSQTFENGFPRYFLQLFALGLISGGWLQSRLEPLPSFSAPTKDY